MDIRKETQNLIRNITIKYETLLDSSEYMMLSKENKKRFVATGMLDYFLTQINPGLLAEYREYKEKNG